MGLGWDEFYDLHEDEYDYKVRAYNIARQRAMEPARELMTLVHNMMAEKGNELRREKLMPLPLIDPDPRLLAAAEKNKQKSMWERFKANNFFKSSTPKAEK